MTGMQNALLAAYRGNTSIYSAKSMKGYYGGKFAGDNVNPTKTANVSKMRQVLRKGSEASAGSNTPISVVDSMKMYSDVVKKQRTRSSETALAKKKLKYSFKSISSKIISSKTSMAARQVVGQAKREIQKLKNAKRTGKYDSDEIDAAIDHAKAMERIARKKVRHLEEEEMAKRCSSSQNEAVENDPDVKDEESPEKKEIAELRKELDTVGTKAENKEYIESEEITNEMIDEICDSMEKMLDQIEELTDLMEELVSDPTDMDSEDIKSLIIKHRNKEMKEITKADSDYLKSMFEHYENERSGTMPAGTPDTSGYSEGSAPSQVLDVAL